MAGDAIGGALTFSTAIDNSDLEKGLEEAKKKVEELKESLEKTEVQKSAIEQQMEDADRAIDATKIQVDELKAKLEELENVDPMDSTAWFSAQSEIDGVKERINELNASLDEQYASQDKLNDQWQTLDSQAQQYSAQLENATERASSLSQRVSSFYYQAGKAMQSSVDDVTNRISQLGMRINNLVTSALVFSVLRQGLNTVKNGIAEALMQNEAFSASWSYLTAAAQGFANGIANAVAPVLVQVVNGVTACIMTLARAIDSVFKTSLSSSISAAQKAAQESWRQTDASKAAQKQAEANAKAKAKQEEQYAKAQERYRKQQEKAAERAAKAQEKLDERRAEQEQKYPDALADAAEKQAKAEQDMAEKRAEAEETAQERMEKAQAKAQERQAKAEESAAKRLEKAQKTASDRMAAAEQANVEKQQAAAERLSKAQEKASQRQATAEAKANQRLEKAQESAQKRLDAAEQANAERQATADERLADAQAKAQARLEKAQAQAAEKTKAAQEAYDQKVAAAQAKDAKAAAAAEAKQAKAAAKLEKAQKKANQTLLGFDELNKMNEEATEDATDAITGSDGYTSALEGLKPPKTYEVDPNDYLINPDDYKAKLKEIDPADYMVDPADYAIDPNDYLVNPDDYTAKLKEIDPSDYMVDPSEYAIDPSDYLIDPSDYAIDYDKYTIDPEDFFVDPEDYAFDPSDYVIDPEDYAIDPFEFDWTEFPEISSEEGLKPNWDAFDVGKIDQTLTEIMAICSGALLAIGAILAFSGINIPLGIALMAVGALGLATVVGENWSQLPAEVQQAITNALVITGMVLIVLGAVIAFSGVNLPVGIGMMVAGALLEWSAVALNWDSLPPQIQTVVSAIMFILGAAYLVIGAILVFTGANVPLGIALMIVGALDMVASVAINWDSLPPQIQNTISIITAIVSAAFLVVGAVLLFTGANIPLGLGLIAVGAIGMAADAIANWEWIQANIDLVIIGIEMLVGVAFLAIGAVLLFSGANVPLGLGLLAVGAIGMGAVLAENWGILPPQIQSVIAVIEAIVGIAFLVIGAILLFSGANVPLGLGLIAVGALTMAAVVTANWGLIPPEIQAAITAIEVIVGIAYLAVGSVLLFSGSNIPLGLGLIAVGALTMGAALMQNWDSIPPQVQMAITAVEVIVGAAFLVVGAILVFSGTNIPLGLGLLAFGALSMGAAAAENWEYVSGNVNTAISIIETALFGAAIVVGAVLTFSAANAPLGLALMATGALGMATAFEENWEKLPQDVQNVIAAIDAAVSVAFLALGCILAFSTVNIPLGIGLIILGVAGLAAETEVNWEQMPTDIKTVVDAILTIAGGAMLVLGIILCFTGVGIPLGVALILAGAASLATEVAINWDFIKNKVEEIWNGITQWWNSGPAQVFTVEWWTNLFACIPNAIVEAINAAVEAFNSFMEGISNALGSLVGATGGSFGTSSSVPSVRPPGLARGAVIPPNREFMAVLGDQTRGNNIETPESLMRQVVREEAGSMMAEMMMQMQSMGGQDASAGDTNLVLNIDGEELARATAKGTSSLTRRGVLSPSASFV